MLRTIEVLIVTVVSMTRITFDIFCHCNLVNKILLHINNNKQQKPWWLSG